MGTGAPKTAKSSTSHDRANQSNTYFVWKKKQEKNPEGERPALFAIESYFTGIVTSLDFSGSSKCAHIPVCARACMQKPTTWLRRDGVALASPDRHVTPATKIEQCTQKARARHAHKKSFLLDHPVSRPDKICTHAQNMPTKRAQAQGTPTTHAVGCMLQRMQRHQSVRSRRRCMRFQTFSKVL